MVFNIHDVFRFTDISNSKKKPKMKPFDPKWTIAAGAYLRFLSHEAARSISTPPGQDASPVPAIC